MVVGWVNYAGIVLCIDCAETEWNNGELEQAQPIWLDTYGAQVACTSCKRLVNQSHRAYQLSQWDGAQRWQC